MVVFAAGAGLHSDAFGTEGLHRTEYAVRWDRHGFVVAR